MEILEFWHSYRIQILVAFFVFCAGLRFYFYSKRAGIVTEKYDQYSGTNNINIFSNLSNEKNISDVEKRVKNATPLQIKDLPSKRLPQKVIHNGNNHAVGSKYASQSSTEAIKIIIFYFSLSGSSKTAAKRVAVETGQLRTSIAPPGACHFEEPEILDIAEIELEDYFVTTPKLKDNLKYFYIFLIPTYDIDTMLNTFLEYLEETHNDFRIDNTPLRELLGYSVFGFGDKETWPTEKEGYCAQAIMADKWMAKLSGRKRSFPLGTGDVRSDVNQRLEEWFGGVRVALADLATRPDNVEGAISDSESDGSIAEVEIDSKANRTQPSRKSQKRKRSSKAQKLDIDDLEDLGSKVMGNLEYPPNSAESDVDSQKNATLYSSQGASFSSIKEMVPKTSSTYKALTKQGYTIVGSHSGVKICRWTKSALRGRGSCYKYTFYGIQSHLCMETTPSLSCSNKCVFCWRHGTNPVGTTWRWQVNPPEMIFEGVKAGHYQKIKMLKGVPGIRSERFAEAMQIKHCALSLVGEPIFYPHINEFTALLHAERISSFLVCNAQHPDHLERLAPVTQLYVSIDASNKDSLRKIDRPLHRDFWERFCRCLDILCEKRFRQRTVFRLTLVKGFNIEDEVDGYADLVARGLPCFVEVKGVTYCGTSTSSNVGLTMQNVPFWEEVAAFVVALNEALNRKGLEYGIAAEHAHSCCALLASERFRKRENGKWCTLIDYDKFFECLNSGMEFRAEDYMGEETPEWALWGNGGFNPSDQRFYRKGGKSTDRKVKS